MNINITEKNYNTVRNLNNRNIITASSALGILRQQLVSHIGNERLKGFLISFGWKMGVSDAELAIQDGLSIESLIKKGPIYHCTHGHINGIEYEVYGNLDSEKNLIPI